MLATCEVYVECEVISYLAHERRSCPELGRRWCPGPGRRRSRHPARMDHPGSAGGQGRKERRSEGAGPAGGGRKRPGSVGGP